MYRFLPLTVSLQTAGGIASPLILRGTPLPAKRQQVFSTYEDNQQMVEITALIGERKLAKDNIVLAKVKLGGIPKMKKGGAQIEVVFEITQELKLSVFAKEVSSGKTVSADSSTGKSFSKERVAEIIDEAEKYRDSDEVDVKKIELRNNAQRVIDRAEDYLAKNSSAVNRSKIEQSIAAIGIALEGTNEADLASKTADLEIKLSNTVHDPFAIFRDVFDGSKYVAQAPQKTSPAPTKRTTDVLKKPDQTPSSIGKIFGGIGSTPDPNLCFVLMPFAEKVRPVYEDHIRPIIKKQSMNCVRADEMVGINSITKDIWAGICNARFLVADLTGKNANVFYEVGLAHALGKDVILITQSMNDVPFDLKALRCIVYEYTPRGMTTLEQKLEQIVLELIRSA